jgi:Zn-dependent protease
MDAVLLLTVVLGVLAAVLVHEGGHAMAAKALGATRVRLRLSGFLVTTEADLPNTRGCHVAFLCAGPLANVGAAVALLTEPRPVAVVLGSLQLVFGVLNLLPFRKSDGQQLLRLLKEKSR